MRHDRCFAHGYLFVRRKGAPNRPVIMQSEALIDKVIFSIGDSNWLSCAVEKAPFQSRIEPLFFLELEKHVKMTRFRILQSESCIGIVRKSRRVLYYNNIIPTKQHDRRHVLTPHPRGRRLAAVTPAAVLAASQRDTSSSTPARPSTARVSTRRS